MDKPALNIPKATHLAGRCLLSWFSLVALSFLFIHFLFLTNTFTVGPDQTLYFTPLFFDLSHYIQENGIGAPLISFPILQGLPHWNNPNFHPLYPLYFNYLGADPSPLATINRLDFIVVLHLSILSANVAILTRTLGAGRLVAATTGIATALTPSILSAANWVHIIASIAWLPAIFASTVIILKHHSAKLAATLALGTTAALMTYAQPAQNVIITAIAVSSFLLIHLLLQIRGCKYHGYRHLLSPLPWLLGAGCLTLLLTGKYMLAVFEFHKTSIRWLGDGTYLVGDQSVPLQHLGQYAYGLSDLPALFFPDAKASLVVGNPYIGSAAIVILALSFGLRRNRSHRSLILAATLLCSLSFVWTAVHVTQYIPLAARVREVAWWTCASTIICLPVAASNICFFARWTQFASGASRWRLFSVASVICCILAYFIHNQTETLPISHRLHAALSALCVLPLFSLVRKFNIRSSSRTLIAFTCLSLTAYSSFAISHQALKSQSTFYSDSYTNTMRTTQEIARVLGGEKDNFRVHYNLPDSKTYAMIGCFHGLRSLRGEVHPQDFDKFQSLFWCSESIRRIYGVKYTVTKADDIPQGAGHTVAWQDNGLVLTVDDQAASRVSIRNLPIRRAPKKEILARLQSADPNFGQYMWIEDEITLPENTGTIRETSMIKTGAVTELTVNKQTRIAGSILSFGPGALLLNEDHAEHWSAMINGKQTQGVRVNGYQTAFFFSETGSMPFEISLN